MTDGNDLYISVPRDVAVDLIEDRIARPLLRTDRVDAELLPAIAIAVTSAATTVVVTELSRAAIRGLTSAIGRWMRREPAVPQVSVSIVTRSQTNAKRLSLESSDDSLADLEATLFDTLTQTDVTIGLPASTLRTADD